jgi:NAD(P)-dependent dehydrogenase (short-subunit alcohol dehydrogenase family)
MSERFDQRVIVITGATGALGNLAAHSFAECGASLALLDNNQEKLDELVRGLNLPEARLLTLVADLRSEEAVHSAAETVFAKFGRVDGLFHLVGGWTGGKTFSETSVDDLDFMLNQHVWTTFHLFRTFGPRLAANGWGRVIIVSMPLSVHPAPKMSAYAAGKAAQEALVETLAEELKDNGVTANIIHVKSIDVKGEGKGTTPAEIVASMLYLCSDEAAKINGVKIPLYRQ